jgi:O-antigen ligase
MLLGVAPPLFVPVQLRAPWLRGLLTLQSLPDNKWLVVVLLAAASVFLIALAAYLRPPTQPPRRRGGEGGAAQPVAEQRDARDQKDFGWRTLLVGGAGFLAIARILAAAASREPVLSLYAVIPWIALIALFGAIVWDGPSPAQIRKLAVLPAATGALIGVLALLQHAGLDPLAGILRYREATRYRTGVFVTLGNPEYLGGYLAPLVLVMAGFALSGATWRTRAAAGLSAVAILAATLLTGSRGAFLGLLFGALVFSVGAFLVEARLPARIRIGGLAAGLALAAIVVGAVYQIPESHPAGLLRRRMRDVANPYSESLRSRTVFNLIALELAREHPLLGIGPGLYGVEFWNAFLALERRDPSVSFEVLARDFNGRLAEHAHNDWLEIWAETGLLGLAAWMALLAVWAVAIIRALAAQHLAPRPRILLVALASAVLALLVNALFNFPLHDPARASLFWLLLALSARLAIQPAFAEVK